MRAIRTRRPVRFVVVAAALTAVAAACTPPPSDGGSGTTTTTTTPSNDPRHCPARGAGQNRVAIVVEFGPLAGGTSVTCVVVGPGASGVTALAARAARLGTPAPRYNAAGLLCAIDGKPAAPACGTPTGGSFDYWSYWIGGSAWTYSNVGPASRAMLDGTVEGWRFIGGGGNVAPASSPSFATLTS